MEKTKAQMIAEIEALQETVARLQAKLDEQKHLSDVVSSKDLEMVKLNEALHNKYSKQIEEKEHTVKLVLNYLQTYQIAYRSFLKNVQGGLENAVELEAMLSEQLNKKP
jgi:sugar-specific transcriptional regulator TrmB